MIVSPVVGADVRDLGIGVRAPRDDQRARALAAEEQRVLDDDARQRIGGVGELERRADVAGREDPAVRRAQVIVDGDAVVVEGDAGGARDRAPRRSACGRRRRAADRHGRAACATAVELQPEPSRAADETSRDRGAEPQRDAVRRQPARDDRRGVGVLARQHLRRLIEERDLRCRAARTPAPSRSRSGRRR